MTFAWEQQKHWAPPPPKPGRRKEGRKERGESCRQFRSDGNHPKKQVTVEPAQAAEKASEGIVKRCPSHRSAQVKKPAALVPAQKSQQQEYKTIAPEQLSADAIQTGAGKLVIVIGQEPSTWPWWQQTPRFFGKVNGKPVVSSILVARPTVWTKWKSRKLYHPFLSYGTDRVHGYSWM